ncbi:MAG: DNA replication and repair protein RecF [Polyangiaceae bacterium]|nr:DNA replication and repair protein RecF [Polyangiaceae bacterium]
MPDAVAHDDRGTLHVALRELVVERVRNLGHLELEPAPGLNLIAGDNGQGKTSILEAIYLVATSRSFRTSRLAQVVAHGANAASIRAAVVELDGAAAADAPPGYVRHQSIGLDGARRVLRLDGEPPVSLAHYATRTPVVVFHPAELELSTGAPAARRELLDRVSLFQAPETSRHRAAYARALRARRELLRQGSGARELDAFEAVLAEHGAALCRRRARACETLAVEATAAFARLAPPELALGVRYEPGGSPDPEQARAELLRGRARDVGRPSPRFGPHHDDLGLTLDGRPARQVASQGQHRALTMALKLAELGCIAAARGLEPILLLDDVSSELDRARSTALFALLGAGLGQVFVTTARPDLLADLPTGMSFRSFRVARGALVPAA